MALPEVMIVSADELEQWAGEFRREARTLEEVEPARAKKFYAAACGLTGDANRLREREAKEKQAQEDLKMLQPLVDALRPPPDAQIESVIPYFEKAVRDGFRRMGIETEESDG